ncbi:MAG: ribonuclease H-like domain-containing protein [Gammaproteobacteria bacterium]|jgi:hypothetical protein
MSLKSRLSCLQRQAGVGPVAPKPSVSTLRERIAQLETRGRSRNCAADRKAPTHPSLEELARTLGGERIADGLIRIHRRLSLQGRLGSIPLQSLQPDPRLPGERESRGLRQLYIDTETTGLSGGSGTLAFLIGVAVLDGARLELTQFLLTRFGAEADLLSAFAESLSPDDRLVSYNGKSYDLPLLATRFRMHSLPAPFAGLPHLDLLHPVRRLFGRRWNDCRLTTLEQRLLGFGRVDDLPGSEAPAAWFAYVRFGHSRPLIGVVAHNRQDVLSLAVAHSALAEAAVRPRAFGVDLYALARWLAEHREAEACELLQASQSELCDDGQRLLARLLRRAGRWQQAVPIWEALAARGCIDSLERLAKYHEHVSRDLAAARRCCEALSADAAHERRRRRVQLKLERLRKRRTAVPGGID